MGVMGAWRSCLYLLDPSRRLSEPQNRVPLENLSPREWNLTEVTSNCDYQPGVGRCPWSSFAYSEWLNQGRPQRQTIKQGIPYVIFQVFGFFFLFVIDLFQGMCSALVANHCQRASCQLRAYVWLSFGGSKSVYGKCDFYGRFWISIESHFVNVSLYTWCFTSCWGNIYGSVLMLFSASFSACPICASNPHTEFCLWYGIWIQFSSSLCLCV